MSSRQHNVVSPSRLNALPPRQLNAVSPTVIHHSDSRAQSIRSNASDGELPQIDDVEILYSYQLTSKIESGRHMATQSKLSFRLTEVAKKFCAQGYTVEILSLVLDHIMSVLCDQPGHVRVSMDASGELQFPITDSMCPTEKWDSSLILSRLESLLTSYEFIAVHENFMLNVFLAKKVGGSGRAKPVSLGRMESKEKIATFLKSLQSTWSAKSNQESCFIQILAYVYLLEKFKKEQRRSRVPIKKKKVLKDQMFNKRYTKEMKATVAWIKNECGLNSNILFISIEDIPMIERYMRFAGFNIQVTVYADCNPESVLYESSASLPPDSNVVKIAMLLSENHYWLIKNPKGFFQRRGFCDLCGKFFNNQHSCAQKCNSCKTVECAKHKHAQKPVYCVECNRGFKSQFCFTKHKVNECARMKRCPNCSVLLKNDTVSHHKCGYLKCCMRCGESDQPLPHIVCFVKAATRKETAVPSNVMYIFYDVETYVCAIAKTHKCYLVTAQKVCLNCIDIEESARDVSSCSFCSPMDICYFGTNSMHRFVQDVLSIYDGVTKNIIITAHSGGSFDNYFFLRECLRMKVPIHSMICKGSRILSASICGGSVKMIDSLNFLLAPLRQLGKFLGLSESQGKLWFPFGVVKSEEDLNYSSDCLPDRSFYPTERMSARDLGEFESYYVKHQHESFDLRARATDYCRQDTVLLRLAVSAIRRFIFTEFQVDILYSCCTIGQAAALIYRRCFLAPKSIPNIPPAFEFGTRRDSKLSITYLSWVDHVRRRDGLRGVSHHGNSPQGINIEGISVDGYSEDDRGKPIIFFVNGCFFHSCFVCGDNKALNRFDFNRGGHVKCFLDKTIQQSSYLEAKGYKCEIIWEHQILELRKSNVAFDTFCKDKQLWRWYHEPMNSRSAMKGGRSEIFHALVELSDEEMKRGDRILTTDMKSQYPYVMLCRNLSPENEPQFRFPLDLPTEVLLAHQVDCSKINEWSFYEENFGLFSCDILPPRNIHIPCLPVHSDDGRLVFPLCHSCMNTFCGEINRVCTHSADDRMLHGAWTSVEIAEAIRMGYEVVRIVEAWIWRETSTELFSGYIRKFLACKFQNEGYPQHILSDEDKADFLQSYEDSYGIRLDPHQIQSNELARYIYKRFCNVLFGKLSESKPRSTTRFTTSPSDLRSVMFDSTKKLQAAELLDEEVLFLQYTEQRAFSKGGQFLNDFIASLVTAFARTMMVRRLSALGDQAIYTDTDSITYLYSPSNPSHVMIPEGDKLGQFQSELKDKNHFIKRFIAIGPKAYMYEVWKENADGSFEFAYSKSKLKGIVITADVEKQISFDNLK